MYGLTQLSFGIILQHKAKGGTWTFWHCDIRSYTDLENGS